MRGTEYLDLFDTTHDLEDTLEEPGDASQQELDAYANNDPQKYAHGLLYTLYGNDRVTQINDPKTSQALADSAKASRNRPDETAPTPKPPKVEKSWLVVRNNQRAMIQKSFEQPRDPENAETVLAQLNPKIAVTGLRAGSLALHYGYVDVASGTTRGKRPKESVPASLASNAVRVARCLAAANFAVAKKTTIAGEMIIDDGIISQHRSGVHTDMSWVRLASQETQQAFIEQLFALDAFVAAYTWVIARKLPLIPFLAPTTITDSKAVTDDGHTAAANLLLCDMSRDRIIPVNAVIHASAEDRAQSMPEMMHLDVTSMAAFEIGARTVTSQEGKNPMHGRTITLRIGQLIGLFISANDSTNKQKSAKALNEQLEFAHETLDLEFARVEGRPQPPTRKYLAQLARSDD